MTLRIMAPHISKLSIVTLSILMLTITTLSMMPLYVTTYSQMTSNGLAGKNKRHLQVCTNLYTQDKKGG